MLIALPNAVEKVVTNMAIDAAMLKIFQKVTPLLGTMDGSNQQR